MSQNITKIAIDGNEANISNRVGSNVYAFEIIGALAKLTKDKPKLKVTVLLSHEPIAELPQVGDNWQYQVLKPKFLWTQFAEPIHLFLNRQNYDVLFTPGHYAPRLSAVPYISSVMDLAYLKYPEQFNQSDLVQLKHWTQSSLKKAKQIITISQFSKQDIIDHYQISADKIKVAYPAINKIKPAPAKETRQFFRQHRIKRPYFLFVGTFQPRKNITRLIEAYEQLCRRLSGQELRKKKKRNLLPQLILAGKMGWQVEPILERIEKSPFKNHIIQTGFIADKFKPALYEKAVASLLVGLHEGFGIPPLESLYYNCLPIVSKTTSLPEAVGEAGLLVDPYDIKNIADKMEHALKITSKKRSSYHSKAQQQLKKFNWLQSAELILETILEVTHEKSS